MRDTSTAGINASIIVPTTSHTAIRESTTAVQVGALSNQRVTLEMQDMRSGALGRSVETNDAGFNSLRDLISGKALMVGNAEDALRVIDATINEVSSERGRLGAIESASLESTVGSLRLSIESLTESESQLRDADYALESAKFAQQNIIFQAATSMLAQANQLPQTVLQLLG